MKLPLCQGFAKKIKIHTALYYINIISPSGAPKRRRLGGGGRWTGE